MIVREARLDDGSAICKVHVDTWRMIYSGIIPEDYLAKFSYEKRESSWVQMLNTAIEDNHFVYVVEDRAGQIIGFADGGLERTSNPIYKGELYAIYILKKYQRKGIGRCLTLSVVERLFRLGIHSMIVWVLVDNPACKFYEALGGEKIYEKQVEKGGIMLNEIAYGWIDIQFLISG